jgi:hypothetical protein
MCGLITHLVFILLPVVFIRMVIIPSSSERTWAVTRLEIAITKIASTILSGNIVGSNLVRKGIELEDGSFTLTTHLLTHALLCSFHLMNSTGDIHNYDSSQIPPEWHGWMSSMNDATPDMEEDYIKAHMDKTLRAEISHVPWTHNLGHQEPYFNFHNMHNQSQIRSRGYGIGNPIVGLPPGAPDAYYTQPGSPYNPASIRPRVVAGDLDEAKGGGRPYKNAMWMERLKTAPEKAAEKAAYDAQFTKGYKTNKTKRLSPRDQAILARGGTLG